MKYICLRIVVTKIFDKIKRPIKESYKLENIIKILVTVGCRSVQVEGLQDV